MPRVSVASSLPEVIEDLGLDFVDCVKGAKKIAIVSTASREATQALIDAIDFHCRTPIVMIDEITKHQTIDATILRPDGIRMPIHRPAALADADVVMAIGAFIPDVRRRTELSIEQYCFETWIVPERSSRHFLRPHDPWLEGELRDEVIADLYAQKPITISFLDGSASTGTVLAGFDAVAVDAVAAKTRDIDPESIGYLSLLSTQGLGVCALSKIDVPLGMIM